MTCKRLRYACEPFTFDKLALATAQATVQAVEELRGFSSTKKSPASPISRKGPLKQVKELSIKSVQAWRPGAQQMTDRRVAALHRQARDSLSACAFATSLVCRVERSDRTPTH